VRFDSRGRRRAYSHHSPGLSSGSGGARLGLSQKGDLPSSGERAFHLVQWSKVADARKAPIMGRPAVTQRSPWARFTTRTLSTSPSGVCVMQ